jgi:hypothetical protein
MCASIGQNAWGGTSVSINIGGLLTDARKTRLFSRIRGDVKKAAAILPQSIIPSPLCAIDG